MREIKFRCWHRAARHLGGRRYAPGMVYDEKPGDCLVWKNNGQDIEDIMQFTGLHDKNGKEIWEGDIVKSDRSMGSIIYYDDSFVISWIKNPLGFNDNLVVHIKYGLKVIGNIYENPTLLEVTE